MMLRLGTYAQKMVVEEVFSLRVVPKVRCHPHSVEADHCLRPNLLVLLLQLLLVRRPNDLEPSCPQISAPQ